MSDWPIFFVVFGIVIFLFIGMWVTAVNKTRAEKTCHPLTMVTLFTDAEGDWAVCGNREIREVKE